MCFFKSKNFYPTTSIKRRVDQVVLKDTGSPNLPKPPELLLLSCIMQRGWQYKRVLCYGQQNEKVTGTYLELKLILLAGQKSVMNFRKKKTKSVSNFSRSSVVLRVKSDP